MLRFLRIHQLRLILALGLLHGLLYIFLVPPWQHYDEPTHFEYAWLLANRAGLPKIGDYDQTMRRAVANSMIEHNFFRGMNFLPDLEAQNEPVWIGVSELSHPPFYYLLASLPLRLLSSWDVTRQLYAGRFVSLGLYLVSILAAWGMMKELLPEGHALRWMVPISMVLLPGYVDLMTAMNNDVGAAMLFSLFLWGSVCMIRQGFSFRRLLWVGSTALLCCWTKDTVFLALPLLGLVLLFVLFRGRWRWVPWVALAAGISIFLIAVFSWGDASLWIRSSNTSQENPTRSLSAKAVLGRYVLRMVVTPNGSSPSIFQLIPSEQVNLLRGKKVTLGGWIWATKVLTLNALSLYDGHNTFSQKLQIDTSPKFFTISATLAGDTTRVRVLLTPAGQKNQGEWTIFYDGLVMVEGAPSLDAVPQFDGPAAQQGTWGGQVFHNLLRNASGENGGPGIRPWFEKTVREFFPILVPSPSLALGSLLDWRGAGWYYRAAAQNLLRTFWAKFGWGHVPLNLPFTHRPYALLAIFTLAGLGGAGMALWRRRSTLPWNVLLILGIALVGIWGLTFLRGIYSLTMPFSIPVARYVYPVIIPTLLVLNVGWLEIAHTLERWTRLAPGAKFLVHFLLFLGLDIAALSSIIHFYSMR